MDLLVQHLFKITLCQILHKKNHWLFYRVGYVPFTRNCIKIPNIFHEIGVQHLVQLYEESNTDLLNQGLHVEGIFDAETPTETKLRRK